MCELAAKELSQRHICIRFYFLFSFSSVHRFCYLHYTYIQQINLQSHKTDTRSFPIDYHVIFADFGLSAKTFHSIFTRHAKIMTIDISAIHEIQ